MMTTVSTLSQLFLHTLVILFLNLLLINHSLASENPLCRYGYRSALLQFKESFVFDSVLCDLSHNYTVLDSWQVASDCCSWDGVACDVETGHVIRLDLSSSCLFGSINSTSPLFRLVHLKSLNLSYNKFNLSGMPSGFRSLSLLKHLNLTSSNFFGQIPSEMLELTNLVSLDLSSNPMMLRNPSLKDVVETFTHLDKLHLSGVTISSAVPQSLSNLTSLSSLLLTNCSLQGEFPLGVFRLPNLRVLNLQDNPNLIPYLPEFDNVSSPLEELWLDGTNFSGQLPVSIGNLKSLEIFTAGGCRLGGVIPLSVGNLTNLVALDLSSNYFSGRIPSSLGKLFRLTFLVLSQNNFSSGTLNWVGTLTNLQTLGMANTNTFGGIPPSFANLTLLSNLLLRENLLTGQLPSWLGNFTQLTQLNFGNNELEGPIPESVFSLPILQVLFLHYNNLNGSLKYDSFLQMEHLLAQCLGRNMADLRHTCCI